MEDRSKTKIVATPKNALVKKVKTHHTISNHINDLTTRKIKKLNLIK